MIETKAVVRAMLLCIAIAFTSGCYTYRPADSVRPGMEVRARLKTEAAVRRSEGLDDALRYFDGRVVNNSDGDLVLDILVARSQTAFENIVIRDTIRLSSGEIEQILQRKLSTGRTVFATAAVIAGGVLLVKGIEAAAGGSDTDPPGNGNQSSVVPVFSVTPSAGRWLFRFVQW